MRVTVVGCSGSFPGPGSPASCYLVEHDGFRVLLDLGNGALGPLQRHTALDAVDAVLLSHLHADHCLDLCPFYVARRYHPDGPRPRIPVLGPRGTARRMARAYDLPREPGMTREFDFGRLPADGALGPFRVRTVGVNHPVPAFALRLDAGGRSLTYSGDTGPCADLVALAAGTDLALFEASFLDGGDHPPDLHLTARQSAGHAAQAGAGRLVLTHLVPWNDPAATAEQAAGAFDGPLSLASSGAVYDL